MDEQRGIAISQLIEDAKKTNKTIVLIGGIGLDLQSRMLAHAEAILKTQEFAIIDMASFNTREILATARTLPEGRGVVIIEDLNEIFLREQRAELIMKIRPLEYDLRDMIILSDEKKEYGVSKNKKSFSPPKHKGYIQPKFVLRGKHR